MAVFQKIIIVVSLCFFGFLAYVVPLAEKGRAATGEVVDEYYRRYNAGEFDYIRASLLTAGAREYSSTDTLRSAYEKLGKHTGGTRRSFKLLDLKGNRYYYRFDAAYEKLSTTDSFVLVKEKGGYRFEYLPNSYFPCLGGK